MAAIGSRAVGRSGSFHPRCYIGGDETGETSQILHCCIGMTISFPPTLCLAPPAVRAPFTRSHTAFVGVWVSSLTALVN